MGIRRYSDGEMGADILSDEQGLNRESENSPTYPKAINLWDYLLSIKSSQEPISHESVFKSKEAKKYIQVKATVINNGTQILAICTDISRIKQIEKQTQKMRSIFFSSVAHELRTPLNSIIPIIQMIKECFQSTIDPRMLGYLNIILNAGIHL